MTSHLLLALIINPSLIVRGQKFYYQVGKLFGRSLEGQNQGKTAVPKYKGISVVQWQLEGRVDPDRSLFKILRSMLGIDIARRETAGSRGKCSNLGYNSHYHYLHAWP